MHKFSCHVILSSATEKHNRRISVEIINKSSFNNALRHRLKIRQNNWRPFDNFPLVLWPYFANEATYAKDYFVRHTHYECWCVYSIIKGQLQIICNGEVYHVKAGETLLIPPGPRTITAEGDEAQHFVIGIEGYLLRIILENFGLNQCLIIRDFFTKEYEALFNEIYHLLGKKDPRKAPELSLLGYAVLMYAVRFVPQKPLPVEVILSLQFIQRNLFQKITLQDLCKEAGCSRTRLCNLFRQYTSFSPGGYIIEERHKYAKDLLASSPNLPIKQIASYCGYRNQLYFANDFKNRTGMTPTLYREKIQKKSLSGGEILKKESNV